MRKLVKTKFFLSKRPGILKVIFLLHYCLNRSLVWLVMPLTLAMLMTLSNESSNILAFYD